MKWFKKQLNLTQNEMKLNLNERLREERENQKARVYKGKNRVMSILCFI